MDEDRRGKTNHEDAHIDLIELIERLRLRRPEIEEAMLARIGSIRDPSPDGDFGYQAGRRAAVTVVVAYCLTAMASKGHPLRPIPSEAIVQTHRMARRAIPIDAAILSCLAVFGILGEFVLDEAERSGLLSRGSVLRDLRRTQDALLEHLTATVASEYKRERERLGQSLRQRREDLVLKLLAGELADTTLLDYEFDSWHLGVIASGASAGKVVRQLAHALSRQLLSIAYDDNTVWAWLGGQRRPASQDLEDLLPLGEGSGVSLAIGEPARGIAGWRLTHREAQVALRVALRKSQRVTRCADVLLDAAVLSDEVVASSLTANYLAPLDGLRIGGDVARDTIRAYCACNRNVSSTAYLLGVTRKTVESRLHDVEAALGRTLPTCLAELEVALRLNV